ncbi:MAG: SWIM zinc finger family protein [Thermoproteota archaeon]
MKREFPNRVLKKAEELFRRGDVTQLSDTVYSVESQHPEALHIPPHYMVEKTEEGWKCSCKGFENRGICSHIIAVIMMNSRSSTSNKEQS